MRKLSLIWVKRDTREWVILNICLRLGFRFKMCNAAVVSSFHNVGARCSELAGLIVVLHLCSWLELDEPCFRCFASARVCILAPVVKHPPWASSLHLSLCLSLNNTPVLSHRAMAITRWSPTSGRNWTPCWKSLASWTRKTRTVSASELCCGPRTRASRRTCGRYGWRAEPCLRQSSTRQQMKCRKRRERRGIKLGHGISHGGNWRK